MYLNETKQILKGLEARTVKYVFLLVSTIFSMEWANYVCGSEENCEWLKSVSINVLIFF